MTASARALHGSDDARVTIVGGACAPYALPWRPSTRRTAPRRGWLVCVHGRREDALFTGWGDAAPWPGFSTTDPARLEEALSRAVAALVGWTLDLDAPVAQIDQAVESSCSAPEVAAAVELALLDLVGRARGCTLAQVLEPQAGAGPVSVPTAVGVVALDEAVAAVRAGASTLKIKIGAGDPTQDVARLRAVRAEVGDGVHLRADVNGGWDPLSEDRIPSLLDALAGVGLEWLEQPWRPGAPDHDARNIQRWAGRGVPIAADESVVRHRADLAPLRGVDVLVLKPMFLGGLRAASALAAARHAHGLGDAQVALGCAWESAVGRAGVAHGALALAASAPAGSDVLVPGLDAPFAADVGLLDVIEGHVTLPAQSGLGLSLAEDVERAVAEGREVAP